MLPTTALRFAQNSSRIAYGIAVGETSVYTTMSAAAQTLRNFSRDMNATAVAVYFESATLGVAGQAGFKRHGRLPYHASVVFRIRGRTNLYVYDPDSRLSTDDDAPIVAPLPRACRGMPKMIRRLVAEFKAAGCWQIFACAQTGKEKANRCRRDCFDFLAALPRLVEQLEVDLAPAT